MTLASAIGKRCGRKLRRVTSRSFWVGMGSFEHAPQPLRRQPAIARGGQQLLVAQELEAIRAGHYGNRQLVAELQFHDLKTAASRGCVTPVTDSCGCNV